MCAHSHPTSRSRLLFLSSAARGATMATCSALVGLPDREEPQQTFLEVRASPARAAVPLGTLQRHPRIAGSRDEAPLPHRPHPPTDPTSHATPHSGTDESRYCGSTAPTTCHYRSEWAETSGMKAGGKARTIQRALLQVIFLPRYFSLWKISSLDFLSKVSWNFFVQASSSL